MRRPPPLSAASADSTLTNGNNPSSTAVSADKSRISELEAQVVQLRSQLKASEEKNKELFVYIAEANKTDMVLLMAKMEKLKKVLRPLGLDWTFRRDNYYDSLK